MSTFDPTKPLRYRFGEEPLAVFVLPTPQTGGETIVSVRRTGLSHTHHPSGRLTCSGLSDLDLINIPEKRTISVWAVINADGDVIMVAKEKPCDPMFAAAGRKVVELTKVVEL